LLFLTSDKVKLIMNTVTKLFFFVVVCAVLYRTQAAYDQELVWPAGTYLQGTADKPSDGKCWDSAKVGGKQSAISATRMVEITEDFGKSTNTKWQSLIGATIATDKKSYTFTIAPGSQTFCNTDKTDKKTAQTAADAAAKAYGDSMTTKITDETKKCVITSDGKTANSKYCVICNKAKDGEFPAVSTTCTAVATTDVFVLSPTAADATTKNPEAANGACKYNANDSGDNSACASIKFYDQDLTWPADGAYTDTAAADGKCAASASASYTSVAGATFTSVASKATATTTEAFTVTAGKSDDKATNTFLKAPKSMTYCNGAGDAAANTKAVNATITNFEATIKTTALVDANTKSCRLQTNGVKYCYLCATKKGKTEAAPAFASMYDTCSGYTLQLTAADATNKNPEKAGGICKVDANDKSPAVCATRSIGGGVSTLVASSVAGIVAVVAAVFAQ